MCYAFTDNIKGETDMVSDVDSSLRCHMSTTFLINDSELKTVSLKRCADTALEHDHRKVTKRSHQGDTTCESDQSGITKEANSSDEAVATLRMRLALTDTRIEMIEKDRDARIDQLNRALNSVRERNDHLIYEIAELQVKEEKRKETTKAEQKEIRTTGTQAVKKARENIGAEWKKKWDAKRADHAEAIAAVNGKWDARVQDLKKKHEKQVAEYQKKADEMKLKIQQLEKEMKEMKTNYTQAEKDLKAEHQRIQKDAKSHYQEQMKQCKPEHSKAVKEKESLLKEKQKEITNLERAQDNSKEQILMLENKVHELQSQEKKLEEAFRRKHADMKKFQRESEELIAKHNSELVRAGDKWQVENNKAEKFAHDLTQQRSANFVLRTGLEKSTNRLDELKTELLEERQRFSSCQTSNIVRKDASTQTGEVDLLACQGIETEAVV